MSESSAASNTCPKCGAALPTAATAGLCPRCLMAEAMAPTQADAEPAPPRNALSPAELAPHFPQLEILECLGRGGMGVVYKARQKLLNRLVALKLLAPERVADATFAERFTHEAQALAALNHPSIVTIYDFGQAGGFYFLLMEFVDGVNLRQAMKVGHFTPEQALAIVPPICDALQCAHEHGIVHRDIKPENLLLDKEGRVKIADFGIAKMLGGNGARLWSETQPQHAGESEPAAAGPAVTAALQHSTAGTPQYMAPEQKAHRTPDHRADIYSLGVVLYELLTGELPADKLQPPSRRVQIDVRLDEIVLRALEVKPELRYQTAADFRTQVETVVSTPRSSRREEAQTPASAPRLLNASTCYLSTPEQLGTFNGQFFLYRRKGQVLLDDRQLAFVRAGTTTLIPLAAIRDLSIGHYPRVMNPAGLDFISVTYDEGGQIRRLFFSPSESLFGLPWHFNQFVAEWFNALRAAILASTGRVPSHTPADQLGVPPSSKAILALLLVSVLFPLLAAGLLIRHGAETAPRMADNMEPPRLADRAKPPQLTPRAGAITMVHAENQKVTIEARLDGQQELRFFVGDETLGWSMSAATAGAVTATVEASDQIRLEDGSMGIGFIIRAGGDTAYVAITPAGLVPFGQLEFRADKDFTVKEGVYTFADIRQADGTRVPVSVKVRRASAAPAAPNRSPKQFPLGEFTNQIGYASMYAWIMLAPGETIESWLVHADGRRERALSSENVFSIRGKESGICSWSWPLPPPFDTNRTDEVVNRLRERWQGKLLSCTPGLPVTVFTITNEAGARVSGELEFNRTAGGPAESAVAEVRLRDQRGLLLFLTSKVPAGHSLHIRSAGADIQASHANLSRSSSKYQNESTCSWMWTDAGFDQAAAAKQVATLFAQGPLLITNGQPRTVFSVTNAAGKIYAGQIELRGQPATK